MAPQTAESESQEKEAKMKERLSRLYRSLGTARPRAGTQGSLTLYNQGSEAQGPALRA